MENLEQLGDFIATQKLKLAASNLQHLLKIQDEQVTLDAIVQSLQQTLIDAHGNNPTDFRDILAAQTRILDGVFHFYMNNAQGKYTSDDKVNLALRAQRQTERAINMWSRLSERDRIKKFPERTRQNAPLDT